MVWGWRGRYANRITSRNPVCPPDQTSGARKACRLALCVSALPTTRYNSEIVVSPPSLHILPWTSPLPTQAAAWLARGWSGDGPLDLSDRLVIVPTRQSGRRLREALALHAAARHQAVFPPRVCLPEQLVSDDEAGAESTGVATRHEALFAWVEVILSVELDSFDELFPVQPAARNFAWAARLARHFLRVQSALAENGLRMADVPAAAGGPFPELGRWTQLALLERHYDHVLAGLDLIDPQAARIGRAGNAPPPDGVKRMVIVAAPDPHPLAVRFLARCARTIPVEVLVFRSAPDLQADHALFDEWGRPRTEAWSNRALEIGKFESRVHLCSDPSAQAGRIIDAIQAAAGASGGGANVDGVLGIGIADPEIAAPLRNALLRAGRTAFDPEGRSRRSEPLYWLLELLGDLAREPAFATVAALARCPDILRWLENETAGGDRFSPARWLCGLDDLNTRHLPATLAAAQAHAGTPAYASAFPELAPGLERIAGLHGLMATGAFPSIAHEPLARIFRARRFDLENDDDARSVESARAWMQACESVGRAARRFPRSSSHDAWEAALEALGESVRFDPKPADAIELQGWLELLWDDAPHLIVAGLNDGRVPTAIVGDAFLPESLRERLGLKTNAARLARDAYLLQALIAARQAHGRCDLLLGKTSAAGDPLRPSRLLLACDDGTLPSRVRFLFREIKAARAAVPWQRAWMLRPVEPLRAITRMPVTGFRNYLACPFRFYLRHGLRMEPVDPHKAELDARDFGNLCHAAVEAMGNNHSLRETTDAAVLREYLFDALDRRVRAVYGADLPLPLVIQLESARQRLARTAEIQAQLHAEGWIIEEVERPLEFAIGPITVRAKIDRIDLHPESGARRVLDYKTSDKPVSPRSAHLRRISRHENIDALPEHVRFATGGESLAWIDLQLPLYLHALGTESGAPVSCGYFNLPKAANETAIALWDDYAPEWQSAALRCAAGIAEAVAAGAFWPPNKIDAATDDFAALFLHGTAASVAWPQPAPHA